MTHEGIPNDLQVGVPRTNAVDGDDVESRRPVEPVGSSEIVERHAAIRRCFHDGTESRAVPYFVDRRALTSTKITAPASSATMSISPNRVRNRRARIAYPRRRNS